MYIYFKTRVLTSSHIIRWLRKILAMKKFLAIIGWIIGVLFILYFLLHMVWVFKPKKHLNVYILDKTVTSNDRPEHKSVVWLLNYNRFVRPDSKKYSLEDDYYGFIPIDINKDLFDFKSIRINEVDATASVYDAAYFTDCYGVYSFEWYKGKSKQIHSQKVYGGLNQNDFLLLKRMKEVGKLIIGEYNMFSTPTNALVRSKTEMLFDITWSGWSGKYYSTFNPKESNGPPEWMPNLYESQHKMEWPVSKNGIVLLSNDGLIEVLIQGEQLNSTIPKIVASTDGAKKYKIPESVGFEQWFEIVQPGPDTEVPASYFLNLNKEGLDVFQRLGLNPQFPAIVRTKNSNSFYFAGDFAENPAKMFTSKMIGGEWVNLFLYKYTEQGKINFFYKFYTPLMTGILDDYYLNKN